MKQIEKLNKFLLSGLNRAKLRGARGVGKSYFLALFTFHLRIKNLHDSTLKRRILYINDPAKYFDNFNEIKNDIAYFMGTDYLEKPELKEELEKAIGVEELYLFMKKLKEMYRAENIRMDLIIDQYNNLESKKNSDSRVYNFFRQLMELFD